MDKSAKVVVVTVSLLAIAAVAWRQLGAGATPLDPPDRDVESEEQHQGPELRGDGQRSPVGVQRESLFSTPGSQTPRLQTPTSESETGSLRVRVVYGDDDTPAAHIGVCFRPPRGTGLTPRWRWVDTDDSGVAHATALATGPLLVMTGLQQRKHERATIVAGRETNLDITLKDGIDVSGVVVDSAGVPVPGATIVFANWAASWPRTMGKADENGKFLLRQAETRSHIGARAEGFTPSQLLTLGASAGARIEVRIVMPAPGGSVCGTVFDPEGQPVAGAVVTLGKKSSGVGTTLAGGAKGLRAAPVVVETGADGRFRAAGLKPGAVPVIVETETFAPWMGTVDVEAHVEAPLIVRLAPDVSCEGIVLDTAGKPVAGVTVRYGKYRGVIVRHVRTADDGGYRFQALPPGRLELSIHHKTLGNAKTELQGSAGEALRWDVTLSRGLVLAGIVRGKDGGPLAGVLIEAQRPPTGGRPFWGLSDRTEADGKFELIDCPEGPVINLRLRCSEYATLDRVKVDAADGPFELTMRWEGKATARIVGKVVGPDLEPVADGRIRVIQQGDSGAGFEKIKKNGEFEVRGLRPGNYQLRINAGSFAEFVTAKRTLVSGETWDLATVQLLQGGWLHLEVKQPAGTEQERLHTSLFRLNGEFLHGTSIRGKPWRSPRLIPGRYELKSYGTRVIPHRWPVTIRDGEETKLSITARFGNPIDFRFALPGGTDDISSLTFTVTGPGGWLHRQQVSRWKGLEFRYKLGVPVGRYRVRASTTIGHAGESEFHVERDTVEPRVVRVRLR
jgi:Carboxypeptidase regulatory-like domain